jgi:hypothetical protein
MAIALWKSTKAFNSSGWVLLAAWQDLLLWDGRCGHECPQWLGESGRKLKWLTSATIAPSSLTSMGR